MAGGDENRGTYCTYVRTLVLLDFGCADTFLFLVLYQMLLVCLIVQGPCTSVHTFVYLHWIEEAQAYRSDHIRVLPSVCNLSEFVSREISMMHINSHPCLNFLIRVADLKGESLI